MKKITLMLLIAFSAATVNGFAQDKNKTAAKCKLTSGMSCCKKSSSRASLLNAKPAAATVAKTTPVKKTNVKASPAKTTAAKKAA